MSEAILQLEAVSKSYATGPGRPPVEVLRGVSLAVQPGERIAITGPSGSGKTTLLNLMGFLDRPSSGRVFLDGRAYAGAGDDALSRIRNERIGFVIQRHHLLPQCTAIENVLIPALAGRRSVDAATAARARSLLDRVGLTARIAHRPGALSGGECQRVAVARALVNHPAVLLADEPTGSLDRPSSERLVDLLVRLSEEEGMALIVVTHAPAVAGRMGRQLELSDGRLTEP